MPRHYPIIDYPTAVRWLFLNDPEIWASNPVYPHECTTLYPHPSISTKLVADLYGRSSTDVMHDLHVFVQSLNKDA